jgi:GntR family transcriptional regulator/MocR family aminotransferase
MFRPSRSRGVSAGLHALLRLPPGGPTEAAVRSLAGKRRIAVEGLAGHWISGGVHPAGLVIGYARPPAHAYEPALSELASLLSDATTR